VTNAPAACNEGPPAVFVVDDDPSVRAALEDLLASAGFQAESFHSAEGFAAHLSVAPTGWGCVLLDIRMPGQNGLDFQHRMAGLGCRLPVIIVSGHGDVPLAVRAMKQGAIDFLPKPFGDHELLQAVERAIEQDRQRREHEAAIAELQERWRSLSPGERDVLDGVVRGLLSKQIARELHVSDITVRVRRGRIMRKMQVSSVADLVRIAQVLDRLRDQGDSLAST
jgi:FixJ family two-component response regulator